MNNTYENDIIAQLKRIDIDRLDNKSILISGSCGLICSYLIDMLIYANLHLNKNIKIYAISRNIESLKSRFPYYYDNDLFIPVIQDVCTPIDLDNIDFIIHGASNANPNLYINAQLIL